LENKLGKLGVNKNTWCIFKSMRDNIDFILPPSIEIKLTEILIALFNTKKRSASIPTTTPCIMHMSLV
jgi:hypothetical protein